MCTSVSNSFTVSCAVPKGNEAAVHTLEGCRIKMVLKYKLKVYFQFKKNISKNTQTYSFEYLSNQLSISLLRPWLSFHGEWAACQHSSTQSDYFVTLRMSVCGNVKGLCDFSNCVTVSHQAGLVSLILLQTSFWGPHIKQVRNVFIFIYIYFFFAFEFLPLIFDSWTSLGDVDFAVTWARRCVAWVWSACRRRTTTRSPCCCRRLITATMLLPAQSSPPHPHRKTWSAPNPWSFTVMVLIPTHVAHSCTLRVCVYVNLNSTVGSGINGANY